MLVTIKNVDVVKILCSTNHIIYICCKKIYTIPSYLWLAFYKSYYVDF